MNKPILVLLFFTISSYLTAQTLVPEYCFKDSSEMMVFKDYDKSKAFELLCLSDLKDLEIEEIPIEHAYFKEFLDKLEPKLNFKRRKRFCKNLYKAIYDEYLMSYKENVTFTDVITTGDYNCVTATALLALAFEHYNIEYQIILIPTHVYIVAFPKTDNIIIESTAPSLGFNRMLERSLIKMKYKRIAKKHDTNPKPISLKALIGCLYSNYGLEAQRNQDLKLAINNFHKAYSLNGLDETKDALSYYTVGLIATKSNDLRYDQLCHSFTNIEETETIEDPKSVIAHFYKFVVRMKLKTNDGAAYINNLNKCMSNTIKDSRLLDELNDYALSQINKSE